MSPDFHHHGILARSLLVALGFLFFYSFGPSTCAGMFVDPLPTRVREAEEARLRRLPDDELAPHLRNESRIQYQTICLHEVAKRNLSAFKLALQQLAGNSKTNINTRALAEVLLALAAAPKRTTTEEFDILGKFFARPQSIENSFRMHAALDILVRKHGKACLETLKTHRKNHALIGMAVLDLETQDLSAGEKVRHGVKAIRERVAEDPEAICAAEASFLVQLGGDAIDELIESTKRDPDDNRPLTGFEKAILNVLDSANAARRISAGQMQRLSPIQRRHLNKLEVERQNKLKKLTQKPPTLSHRPKESKPASSESSERLKPSPVGRRTPQPDKDSDAASSKGDRAPRSWKNVMGTRRALFIGVAFIFVVIGSIAVLFFRKRKAGRWIAVVAFAGAVIAFVPAVLLGKEQTKTPGMSNHTERPSELTTARVTLLEKDPLGEEGRAVAQALGDLTLNKSAEEALPEELRQRVNKVVDVILEQTAAATGRERMNAKHQLERLWKLSADRLIKNFDNPNLTIAEAAAKTLILMRDERIIRAIIDKVRAAESEQTRVLGVFTLGKMTEQRETIVNDRKCMSREESSRLAREIVIPLLKELERTENSRQVKKAITRSLADLSEQHNRGE